MAARNVEVIPAKPKFIRQGLTEQPKLKVAAYCRVSTNEDEQLSSFEAQTQHYYSYITSNPAWEYAGIFADEGISGTSTKKREQFNNMIDQCLNGNIDMIITKSVSRFARNTLDCLQHIRMLKERNIAVFFEKENINTLDAKGEVLLVIISSLAQEESYALSHNTRWGIVHRFQNGKVKVNHTKFLGYTKDENGELVIVPEEAEIIRRIFREFLEGKSDLKIAQGLERDGILTGAGRTKWWSSTVNKILKNEKYMGDALLQKTYTVDFLNKKRVKNNGIVQQYYVENSHEPIVSKEEFAAVQNEFIRRNSMRGYSKTGKSKFASQYPFSGKLICQNCGSKFRRQYYGKGENKKYIWRCINREINGVDSCKQKPIREIDLEQAFIRAMNQIIGDKKAFMNLLMQNIYTGLENVEHEYSIEQIDARLSELQQELMSLVQHNAKTGIDAKAYDKQYLAIATEMEIMRERKQKVKDAEAERILRVDRIKEIQEHLNQQESPLDTFDEDLFRMLIEKVKILSINEVVFVFKTGVEVKEILI